MVEETTVGQLSAGENEHIFRAEILPDYLPGEIGPTEDPALTVIAGQPGSGSMALLAATQHELEPSGPVVRIVGDDLLPYHPYRVAQHARDRERSVRPSRDDVGIWAEKLLAEAMKRRVHVVYDAGTVPAVDIARVMAGARARGYRIEAHFIAVDPRLSWQGSHYRSEELLRAGVASAIPMRAEHDGTMAELAASLARIEQDVLADRIVIRMRTGEVVYDNDHQHGRWRMPSVAVEKLEEARARIPTRSEIGEFARVWEHVIARMVERSASADLVDEVRRQSQDDLAWFAVRRRQADQGDADQVARDVKRRIASEAMVNTQSVDEFGDDAGRSDRRTRRSRQRGEDVDQLLIPGRNIPDLSRAEIERKLAESARLAEKRAEIERLSKLVYGNPLATSANLKGIDGAAAGSVAADDVRGGRIGPLAGRAGGILRADSPERQTAKAHLPQLSAAMEDYGRAVDFERHRIMDRHAEEQRRNRQEIRAPSKELSAVLAAPAREQPSRLTAAPQLRRELDKLTMSINRRLSAADLAALKTGNIDRLPRSLVVSREQAQRLARVHSQMQAAHARAQSHRRQLDREASIAIRR